MRPLSVRFGRSVLVVASLALALVALELGATLVYEQRTGQSASPEDLRVRIAAHEIPRIPDAAGKGPAVRLALHPYLGFVYDPEVQPEKVNPLGFRGPDPLQPVAEDAFVVGLFGGSLAMRLPAERLASKLRELPRFAGREVVVFNFGVGGYKQPQQLFALAWLYSLGVRLDVVVNLDGFNEMALPLSENLEAGVHPAYPRRWQLFAHEALDERSVAPMAGIGELQASSARWQALAEHPVWRHSRFALAVIDAVLRRQVLEVRGLEENLSRLLGTASAYRVSGPPYDRGEPESVRLELARLWAESSRQMARFSEANGSEYYHFLQPNQYVLGSKTFTSEEFSESYGPPDYRYRELAEAGYPHLIRTGEALAGEGLPFVDLTRVFRDERRRIYVDACCHINELGYEYVIDAMAARIGARPGGAGTGEPNPRP